jgi:hypothetical protein
MQSVEFEVVHAGGRREVFSTRATRVLIGRGAHCDVRLATDQAAAEHLVLELASFGWTLRVLAPLPRCAWDGVAIAVNEVRPVGTGGVIQIADTSIRVSIAQNVAVARRGGRAAWTAAGAAVIALALAGVLLTDDVKAGIVKRPALPDLFDKKQPCPRTDVAEARVLAASLHALATGARERSPFEPREALAAIRNYEAAADCFRRGDDKAAADDAERNAQKLREDVVVTFRARWIRLERLMLVKDYAAAAEDIAVLRAWTDGRAGEFTRWLATVDEEIKVSSTEKK